ncbi:MAG: hypothetical protein QXP53_01875 [Candidatus Pacearchaeota archaeon]
MSFKSLLKQVETSSKFREFKKRNPRAKLYSAFFTLRTAFGNLLEDSQQLDYLIGKERIVTFSLQDDQIIMKEDKLEKLVEKFTALKKDITTDIEDIKEIVQKEMKKQKISSEIQEIVAILQRQKENQIWNIIVVLSSLDMLRLHIDIQGKILVNKKESFADIIKFKKGNKEKESSPKYV